MEESMHEFTNADRASVTWEKVMRWVEGRIEEARTRLERPLSYDDTNITRGQLRELRELQSLNNETPIVP